MRERGGGGGGVVIYEGYQAGGFEKRISAVIFCGREIMFKNKETEPGLKLLTKTTLLAFVIENERIPDKEVQKYFYTFRICQITLSIMKEKRN